MPATRSPSALLKPAGAVLSCGCHTPDCQCQREGSFYIRIGCCVFAAAAQGTPLDWLALRPGELASLCPMGLQRLEREILAGHPKALPRPDGNTPPVFLRKASIACPGARLSAASGLANF